MSPHPPGSSVTIWHSWGLAETETLHSIITSFQKFHPDVTFSLLYIPVDELFGRYHDAAYLRQGPSLLFGPAEWGLGLFKEDLVTDIEPYAPPGYLGNLNPAALATGRYHDSLISLPLSLHGSVMFRNTSLIPTAPSSMDELISASHQATHAGVAGSYLERGAYFSAPNILGLGGQMMDETGKPAFTGGYGLEWLDLLAAFDEAGAVTFNSNRDLEMFKRGRVGTIIDGTWNTTALGQAIGIENLAIDPWPSFGTGHLTGWVQADSVYVNSNLGGDNLFAALSFVGYLLDPNVQLRLAEVGHIPSAMTTEPRDPLIKQAKLALSNGVSYPVGIDDDVLALYWDELDIVIRKVFELGADPTTALQEASDNILQSMRAMQTLP